MNPNPLNSTAQTSTRPAALSALGKVRQVAIILLAMLLVSGVAVLLVRTFNKPRITASKVVADRLAKLKAKHEAEDKAVGTYGWIDKNAGSVHLPVAKAMDLVLPELQAKTVKRSNLSPVAATPVSAPAAAAPATTPPAVPPAKPN
ncbi:MAG: hypothetical protein SFU85_08640 [Candidatus Methylacidiphilales bacterium]|nr:hypothetical protein [Candidatus Methylacidiphilales bacterium]